MASGKDRPDTAIAGLASPGAGAYNAWIPRPKPGAWLPTVSGPKQSEQGAPLPGLRPVEERGRRAIRARHASPGTTGAAMRRGVIAFQWRSNPGSASPAEIGRCRRSSRVFRTYASRRGRTGKATTAREPEFGFRVRSEERRVGKEGRSRWSPYH